MNTYQKHLAAIQSGVVTKSNIIGIRKAINAVERRQAGYSTGATTPKTTAVETSALAHALYKCRPEVDAKLFESGAALLRSPRYRKRWTEWQARVIATLSEICLVRFDPINDWGCVPIFMAIGANGVWFLYRNIPWQSGGNGPEIVI